MASDTATIIADVLCPHSMQEIVHHLRISDRVNLPGLTSEEAETLRTAADALDKIMSWRKDD